MPGDVADEAEVCGNIFADLAWVDVDVNNFGVGGECFGVEGEAVAEPCADRNHHVRFVNGFVGGEASMHSDHAKIAGVSVAQDAGSHNGCGMQECLRCG